MDVREGGVMTAIALGASVGLGTANSVMGAKAAQDNAEAQAVAEGNARAATVLLYKNLGLQTRDSITSYRDYAGSLESAIAGSGVEVGSGATAQLKADALVGLRRDIEALRLNADTQATRLGYGPERNVEFRAESLEIADRWRGTHAEGISDYYDELIAESDDIAAARLSSFAVSL